jgi:hypothetical protein
LQVSLAYQGSSLPLAWDVWEQNVPLPEGRYWQAMDAVLDQAAALLPAGVEVIVLADRAYDIPPFIDRIQAHGWHVIVRLKDGGTVRFRDQQGREWALATLIGQQVPAPGRRWKARGSLFKKAGWRAMSVVSLWAAGYDQRLTVLTDLPPTWCVAAWYRRRFWCEPGFRNAKSRGWQWEHSQVTGAERTKRLLTVMAWATVLVLCLGHQEAARRLQQVPDRRIGRHGPGKPRAVKDSLFLLGLIAVGSWLYGAVRRHIHLRLPDLIADSWEHQWYAASAHRFLATIPFRTKTVRP